MMRAKLATVEQERGQAQTVEHQQRSAVETLDSTLKRKRSQISDLKFVASMSQED